MANLTTNNPIRQNAEQSRLAKLDLPPVNKIGIRASTSRLKTDNTTGVKPNKDPMLLSNALGMAKIALTQIATAETMLQQQQDMGQGGSLQATMARNQIDAGLKRLTGASPALLSMGKKGQAGFRAVQALANKITERNGTSPSLQMGGGTLDFEVRNALAKAQINLNKIK